MLHAASVVVAVTVIAAASSEETLVPNGGFEEQDERGFSGWEELWLRDPGRGRMDPAGREDSHGGAAAARIEHEGQRDWSLNSRQRVDVGRGDVLALEAWVRIEGTGTATPCVAAYGPAGEVVSWSLGGRTARGPTPWRKISSRVVIPSGVSSVLPRVIGSGPARVWLDDISLVRDGNLLERRSPDLPEILTLRSERLEVELRTGDATLRVTDRGTGRTWAQRAAEDEGMVLAAAKGESLRWTWLHVPSGLEVRASLLLDRDRPELRIALEADGELRSPLQYPHPFVSRERERLVIPLNEGISYPVEDPSIAPVRLVAYGGHGICMSFWGVTDGDAGHMAIIETPDDAAVRILRMAERLTIAPEWDSQRGDFGYPRALRYVFLREGGHVAMCKRYREHARQAGLLKTLREKARENPSVDRLVGAVIVWCWEGSPVEWVQSLRERGVERILWSRRCGPQELRALNELGGVLTSRYDIYQDLMDPAVVERQLRGAHPDWTQEGWPDDLMLDESGAPRPGWRVRGKDGVMYPCGVLCDRQALRHARLRVPAELETHPYRCRFIDTTTASPWRECHHPAHPLTRGESRHWKMELLRFMSEEMGLVTGSETGHDAAVPYVHYFEGMLSLGPYRVPDAGRNMIQPVLDVPERVARFQVGEAYRLPLWELVYHDCVVAQWYWGDYNNKLPALWDKRDLFNVLYGTPPMFMFNRKIWTEHADRFARSYRTVGPVARRVGYEEMTGHRLLTEDRRVQQTEFSNGVRVTVNFGDVPFRLPEGTVVEAGGHHVHDPGS